MKAAVVAMVACIAAAPIRASAAPVPLDPPDPFARYRGPNYEACMANSEGVTLLMHNCLADEGEFQDRILNRVYGERMRALPPARRTALRADERRWLKRTKARCDAAVGENEGGSIAPLIIDDCWNDAMVRRILFLRAYR